MLVSNPWAQIGADAIAWELGKPGVSPPPRRTLERVLQRGGAAQQPARTRREAKGVPYPALAAEQVGDLHEADLVGPRHLEGRVRFSALNSVDLASHRAGIEIVSDSGDERVTTDCSPFGRGSACPGG